MLLSGCARADEAPVGRDRFVRNVLIAIGNSAERTTWPRSSPGFHSQDS